MRFCRLLYYDSFKSARGDLSSLFSSQRTAESLREAVRRHLCHAPLRYKNFPEQRRSWLRSGITLLFDEARRRGSYPVACATVEIVLKDPQLMMDPLWVKNAFATCRTPDELRAMESLLQSKGTDASPPVLVGDSPARLMRHEGSGADGDGEHGEHDALLPAGYTEPVLSALRRSRDSAVVAPNASFARYFVRQGLVADDAELMELFEAMRGRAPVGLRVHMAQPYGPVVRELLSGRSGIESLTFMPQGCGAFAMCDAPETPHSVLLANRHMLRSLADERLISYQSTSSMLPVLLLDPRPGEAVLDLCAAPGSKSMLILDYVASQDPSFTKLLSPSSPVASSPPEMSSSSSNCAKATSGCLVANEAMPSRVGALARRLESASPMVAVMQRRGECISVQPITAGGVRYDKVLVDAPCSGEGRMGRDALSWRMWHPLKAMQFFPTQLALLRRAISLCAAGGRVVYATCTLNPLENEAVVAAALADGQAELLPLPPRLTGWKFSRGLRRWLVPSRAGGFIRSAAEAAAKGEEVALEMFSPAEDSATAAAIERCCARVLPHRNGRAEGFFFAVLRKLPHGKSADVTARSNANVNTRTHVQPMRGVNADENHKAVSVALPAPAVHTTESVLHAYGAVRLAPGNALLRRHLDVFFNGSATAFLSRHGLCAAWREGEGLLLVSLRTWERLAAVPASTAALGSTGLGLLAVNAAGELTESGAHCLVRDATAHVVRLPLAEMQSLLQRRTLRVEPQQPDAAAIARRLIAGSFAPPNASASSVLKEEVPAWVAALLQVVGTSTGVFIATCAPPTAPHGEAIATLTASLCVPVQVAPCGTGGAVELRLTLSQDARRRCVAVVGRVIGHTRRATSRAAEKEALRATAARSEKTDPVRSVVLGKQEMLSPKEATANEAAHSATQRSEKFFDI